MPTCARPRTRRFEETLAAAIENFDFIGLTESFDQDLAALTARLDLNCPGPVRINPGPVGADVARAREQYGAALREALADDIALYQGLVDWVGQDRTRQSGVWQTPLSGLEKPAVAPGRASAPAPEPAEEPDADLVDRMEAMAPWHHRIELKNGVFTGVGRRRDATGRPVTITEPAAIFRRFAGPMLPDGMAGKSFLDCGCNAGGYCFAAKDEGAVRTFGFDVRQHWIDQAEFVKANRARSTDGMRFAVADLLGLSGMDEDFDVTWFSGLFYHLPDPVAGLKIAADRTRELIFVNTAVQPVEPGVVERPALIMKNEGIEEVMSGVYGMSWLPTGAETMRRLLVWMGFPETRLLFWHRKVDRGEKQVHGRLMLVGARETGRLEGIRDAKPVDHVEQTGEASRPT